MKRYIVTLVLAVTFASGCASTGTLNSEMASFQGEDASAAIASWGAPDAEYAHQDQTLLVWRDHSSFASVYDLPSATVVCERMLAVDQSGVVTGWRWRGDACPTISVDARNRRITASLQ